MWQRVGDGQSTCTWYMAISVPRFCERNAYELAGSYLKYSCDPAGTNRRARFLRRYVLPGFVTLWGISHFSLTVESWITTSGHNAPTVAGFLYVTLASLAAGLTVSAIRWAIIDTLHHATGVKPPQWEFASLDDRLQGFLALVENHYRYYQFYSNSVIAGAIACTAYFISKGASICQPSWWSLGFVLLEIVLLAGSRDSLRKYYLRAERLLGTQRTLGRSTNHDQRFSQGEGNEREERREETRAGEEAAG